MKWLVVVLTLLLVSSVGAMGDRTIYYPIGMGSNTTINNTYVGQMNQTPNMTASNLDTSGFLFLNGTRAMTGTLDMGTHQITNVVNPTLAQDAATKNYVDTVNATRDDLNGYAKYQFTSNNFYGDGNFNTSGTVNASQFMGTNGIVLRMGDGAGATNVSYMNYSNYQVARIDSLGNAYFNTTGGDLSNYAYKPGLFGGQVLTGGTGANDDLILNGTSSATKTSSYVMLQPNGGLVNIGRLETTVTTDTQLGIKQNVGGSGIKIENTTGDSFLSMGSYISPTLGSIFRISSSYDVNGNFKPISIFTSDTERLSIAANGTVSIKENLTARTGMIGSHTTSAVLPIKTTDIVNSAIGQLSLLRLANERGQSSDTAGIDFSVSAGSTSTGRVESERTNIGVNGNSNLVFSTYNSGLSKYLIINSTGVLQMPAYGAGTLNTDALGNIYVTSDEKTKMNIMEYKPASALTKINMVKIYMYNWAPSSGLSTTERNMGVISQQLKTAIPEAVYSKPDTKRVLVKSGKTLDEDVYEEVFTGTYTDSVSDRAIISVLVTALQEEDREVEAQQKQIDLLTARLDKLEKGKV